MPKASELLIKTENWLTDVTGNPQIKQKLWEEIKSFLAYKQLISEPINVLDHGFVRLVDYMGNDLSIVRAARVSYDADWRTGEDEGKDEKLIRYLLVNRHTSPFECVKFTFEFKAPIFVLRQIDRHRTMDDPTNFIGLAYEKYWSYSEVSARYTELPEEFYIPEATQITTQSKDNKQMRTEEFHPFADSLRQVMYRQNHDAFFIYKSLLKDGCPRELARSVLPTATYTRFFGSVDLHNLLLFLSLRLHKHVQYETRVYAEAILNIIRHVVPITINHWLILHPELGETHG